MKKKKKKKRQNKRNKMQCSKLEIHGVYHHFTFSVYLRDSLLPFLSFGAFSSASDFFVEVVFLSAHAPFPMSVKHLWIQVFLKFCISQLESTANRKLCVL